MKLLLEAIKAGELKKVQSILNKAKQDGFDLLNDKGGILKAEFDAIDEALPNPLKIACEKGETAIAMELVRRGAVLPPGVLQILFDKSNLVMIKFLLESGEVFSEDTYQLLHEKAVREGASKEIAQFFKLMHKDSLCVSQDINKVIKLQENDLGFSHKKIILKIKEFFRYDGLDADLFDKKEYDGFCAGISNLHLAYVLLGQEALFFKEMDAFLSLDFSVIQKKSEEELFAKVLVDNLFNLHSLHFMFSGSACALDLPEAFKYMTEKLHITNVLSLGYLFSPAQFIELLKKLVELSKDLRKNLIISLSGYDCDGSRDARHAIDLQLVYTEEGVEYWLFDANWPTGSRQFLTPETLAFQIINFHFNFKNPKTNRYAMSLEAYVHSPKEEKRLLQEGLAESLLLKYLEQDEYEYELIQEGQSYVNLLTLLVGSGNNRLLKLLLKKGWDFYNISLDMHMRKKGDIHFLCGFGRFPLLKEAIASGHLETFRLLLESKGFSGSYELVDEAMRYSIRCESLDAFRIIMNLGVAQENILTRRNPRLPYLILNTSMSLQFVKVIEATFGRPYVEAAIKWHHTHGGLFSYDEMHTLNMQVVRYFIEENILDVNLQSSYHETLLTSVVACKKMSGIRKFIWIKMLLDVGADINLKNYKGVTARDLIFKEYKRFRESLRSGDLSLDLRAISCLVEFKLLNVNEQSTSKSTILHNVLECKGIDCALKVKWTKALIEFGADLTLKDEKGRCAHDLLLLMPVKFTERVKSHLGDHFQHLKEDGSVSQSERKRAFKKVEVNAEPGSADVQGIGQRDSFFAAGARTRGKGAGTQFPITFTA